MNIFKDFVNAAPVKTQLDFGHNENVVVEKVSFEKKKRNGIIVKSNTYITLTKIDVKAKKPIASTEVSFWDLDHTRDFVKDNFISQFTTLASIVDCIGDVEQFETDVMTVLEGSDDDYLINFLKKADNTKKLQEKMEDAFKTQVEGKVGVGSTLLKCKMVSNKAGFMELSSEAGCVLTMDSEDELPPVTSREKAIFKKATSGEAAKAKPDKTGEAPDAGEKEVSNNSLDAI